jgi:pimeloyl-ACP methyl ester carboxylesterase
MKKLKNSLYVVLVFSFIVLPGNTPTYGQQMVENTVEIHFDHNGDQIHGWFYNASGSGPFSTVILLHGSVGQDGDIFDLGKNLSGAGYNVMTYNYPGSWKSEGIKTDESALASVNSAVQYARSAASIQAHDIDTTDIILMGYSYGGSMALLGSVFNPSIKKVITIACGDLSVTANNLERNPNFRESFESMIDHILQNPTIARATSGADYVESLLENKAKYDLKSYVEALAPKKILFLVGWLDNMASMEDNVLPLYRALKTQGADHLKMVGFETNHNMTGVQQEMTSIILDWLTK